MEQTAVVVVRLRVRGNASVQQLAEMVVDILNTAGEGSAGKAPFVEAVTVDGKDLAIWMDRAELVSSREAGMEEKK